MAKPKGQTPNLFRNRPTEDEPKMDTTPLEMPVGYMTPTPLQDLIAKMVREAVAVETGDEVETMEEANDLEVEDEDLLLDFSPYELQDVPDDLRGSTGDDQPVPDPKVTEPADEPLQESSDAPTPENPEG